MTTTIITKNSSTASAVPLAADLVQGELAVNVTSKALYTKNASAAVVKLNTPSIVDNGDATAITINSSENVGIGTSSPSFQLVTSKADTSSTIGGSTASVHIVNTDSGAFGRLSELVFNLVNQASTSALASVSGQYSSYGGSYGGNLLFSTNAGLGGSVTERARIDTSGNVLVTGAGGLGYGTGSGGTVTQATSKSTTVTLNKPTGQITMNAAALAGNTAIAFAFNNSLISVNDVVLVSLSTGIASATSYTVNVGQMGAGVAIIVLRNTTAGSLSEAAVLNFAIIKGATA